MYYSNHSANLQSELAIVNVDSYVTCHSLDVMDHNILLPIYDQLGINGLSGGQQEVKIRGQKINSYIFF